ncbi:AAA-like domain-containing protein [Nostoc punctiforme UO1]|uniref:AAA-like domain-containing protein n=1 Tax=Nostoc punctiforme TaxID=272131 RepID=UPI0030B59C01
MNHNIDELITFAQEIVYQDTKHELNKLELAVLRGALEDKRYEDMAQELHNAKSTLQNDVGPKLWKKFQNVFKEEVNKNNIRQKLERALGNQKPLQPSWDLKNLDFPNGPVPLTSSFYVERYRYIESDSFESMCYHEIAKPGSLIRIKAPKEMGKTSLLDRIVAQADKQQYQKVRVNLAEVEEATFSNLKNFLSWFCYYVRIQLQMSEQANNSRKEALIDTPTDCKIYFQEHFLKPINSPIVLALDEVDRIFNYPQVSNEFFKMLRVWHEETNNKPIWRNLRLVVVHSTEDYGPLNINESPFNVGKPVELTEFNPEQVLDLALRHKLDWNNDLVKVLMAMVGGHPYLVRLAFYHLAQPEGNLEHFLQNAPTNDGIYRNHLFRYLNILEKNKELGAAFKQVVTTTKAVELGRKQRYKLYSMGLTNRLDNPLMPRCELYRIYFREQMGNKKSLFF